MSTIAMTIILVSLTILLAVGGVIGGFGVFFGWGIGYLMAIALVAYFEGEGR